MATPQITTVKATINGSEYNLTYNSTSQKWEATITAPSKSSFTKEGRYYPVSVTAQDNAGNSTTVNAQSATVGTSLRLVVKEKVAPTIAITYPGASATIINNKPAITAQLRDDDSGINITTLRLKIDNGTAVTNTSTGMVVTQVTGGYNISYTPITALTDGSHTITVEVSDNDGNAATAVSRTFKIDTVPPTLNVTSPVDGLITNQTGGTVSGTTNDATSSPVTVKITLNGKDVGAVTVAANGSFTKQVTYIEGDNTLVITATDSAGKATSITRTVTIDTAPPVFESVELIPNPVDAGATYVIKVSVE